MGVCEGTGRLHRLTSESAASHARELRWMHDAGAAQQAVRTVLRQVRDDGSIPAGLNDAAPSEAPTNALSDWGDAVLALDATHPDEVREEGTVACRMRDHSRADRRHRIGGQRGEVAS